MPHSTHSPCATRRAPSRLLAPVAALAFLPAPPVVGDAPGQDGYLRPPDSIARIAEAPSTPGISVSPGPGRFVLLMHRSNLVPLAELARPEHRLAGVRIDPRATARSRRPLYRGLELRRLGDDAPIALSGLPEPLRADDVRWSPDGTRFAFTHTRDDGLDLHVVEAATGEARLVFSGVNGVMRRPFWSGGAAYSWLPDGDGFLLLAVDPDRGPPPEAPSVPDAPVIQETTGRPAPARTYQDLLASPHDEALFRYYATARAVVVDLAGDVDEIAGPAIMSDLAASPDGRYVMVRTITEPFSYLVPYSRFPHVVEIRDRSGRVVRELARLPLLEEVPIGRDAAVAGPRAFGWRGDADATMYWVEARDGGDPGMETTTRDTLFELEAPFEGAATATLEMPLRFQTAVFGAGKGVVLTRWWRTRSEQAWRLPAKGAGEPTLAFDTSYEDRYAAPGFPMTTRNERGARVLVTSSDGTKAYLTAEGASPEGNRPFVDEWDLETGATRRLFQSPANALETPLAILDADAGLLLTRRETRTTPPNYHLRDLKGDDSRAITAFAHPYPDLEGAGRELIRYARADGVELSALLHTPPGYDPERDGRLPLLVWAYPREYKSAAAAAQVRDSPQRFSFVRWGSALYWLTRGYAVMENATMPIIGEGDAEPNDSYVEQLVASARAAVDEAVRRGVADPDRTAIAGHSYGAFMTANLLAHSDIFRAGIARSGAFNRSLTPFGFQSEERTFWEAPDVYFRMSPFMNAEKVNEPILLIHGAADNNSGTFPIQSRRFYHALKGHGAVARLVMLPHESHGYAARESVMHTLREQDDWLERYVKNAAPRVDETDGSRNDARKDGSR